MTALLIGTILKATLLLGLVFALTALLRERSAALRHLIWSAGLVGLLALPLLSFALPWRLDMLPAFALGPTSIEALDRTVGASDPRITSRGEAFRSASTRGAGTVSVDGRAAAGTVADVSAPGSAGGTAAESSPGRLADARELLWIERVSWAERLPQLVPWLWLLGAALVLARLLLGVVAIRRIADRAEPLEAPVWTGALTSVSRRLGLRKPVQLLRSSTAPMPITFGLLRPTVVLPLASEGWDDARRRAVLLHELAHVQRLDLGPHVLAWIACALYWFHPLVWVAAGRLRHESERACDDLVLGAGTRPSEYAEHLLQIARAAGRGRAPAPAVPMAQRSRFEGRLLAILEPDVRRHRVTLTGVAAILALIGFVVVPLAAIGPGTPAEEIAASDGRSTPVGYSTERSKTAKQRDPIGTPALMSDPMSSVLRLDERGVMGSGVFELPPLTAITPFGSAGESSQEASTIEGRVSALAGALADPVPDVRAAAVQALGELQDPRAVAALARVLGEDPEPEVRKMAAWALGEIEDPAAVPALSSAVREDRDAAVRVMAAWALGEIESADGVPALGEALRDESAEVREKALWALGEIESPEAVPWLVRALDDPDAAARRQAVWALGEIESPAAVEPLMGVVDDRDAEVRGMAIWALGEIEDIRAIPAIVSVLTDGDVEVRRKAVWAIGELQPVSAPPALIAATRDGDGEVRQTAAWALGEIADGAAVPALRALLDDGEPEVRHAAVWALVELDDPAAYAVLVELLKHEDPEVRKAAAQALGDR